MEIGISRITLISAKSHTWSQVDLYHVLYLPEINDWPLHSGKTVSVSAKMQFHAWVTNSGSPLCTGQFSDSLVIPSAGILNIKLSVVIPDPCMSPG